jgi:molybdate transport system substrate-binding protein
MIKALLGAALAATVATALAACGSSGSSPSAAAASAPASASASPLSGTVTVLAASSLTESFNTLGRQFEAAHPGVTVKFSYGASSTLATQITAGAPADVFASASPKNMQQVTQAHDAGTPTTFAVNEMEIAVPPSNPKHIATVADLTRPGTKVALCATQVPCGATARQVFTNAKVTVTPVTLGQDVKSVLTTVEQGEVDAGVVYKTDVHAAGTKVTGVTIPEAQNASTSYPIATLTGSRNAAAARAFVDYVLSADGQKVLAAAGFTEPR